MGLGSLFGKKAERFPADAPQRTPPGQYLTEKWPVLHYGGVPRITLATWSLRLWGEVEQETTLSWEAFLTLPQRQFHNDIHCVTRWSKLDNEWEGVAIHEVVGLVRPKPAATHVLVHSYSGYTTNLPLAELLDDDVLLATRHSGQDLTPDHGWPLRLVVPKLYFWKSAKWVRGIEFLSRDQAGFWEMVGYHNHGDPWREERFSE
ncbi:MAG: molybdopterin-dependent oxidoreductase [Chloroflexi bacterium]|nr:molybdopterin-dependent oxidoreductase [Chloroflexota bacterium]